MGEVAVAAVAEAVAGHVDRGAEAAPVEEVRQRLALGRAEERLGDREPALLELLAQVLPGERVDAVADVGRGAGRGHRGRHRHASCLVVCTYPGETVRGRRFVRSRGSGSG